MPQPNLFMNSQKLVDNMSVSKVYFSSTMAAIFDNVIRIGMSAIKARGVNLTSVGFDRSQNLHFLSPAHMLPLEITLENRILSDKSGHFSPMAKELRCPKLERQADIELIRKMRTGMAE